MRTILRKFPYVQKSKSECAKFRRIRSFCVYRIGSTNLCSVLLTNP